MKIFGLTVASGKWGIPPIALAGAELTLTREGKSSGYQSVILTSRNKIKVITNLGKYFLTNLRGQSGHVECCEPREWLR